MFDHIRSRIRIPLVVVVPLVIGGLVVLFFLARDTKAKEAAALTAVQQKEAAEDAELSATLRARLAPLARLPPGTDAKCSDSFAAIPVVQQAWIASTKIDAYPVQTRALEQLASGESLAPPVRQRRNDRLRELATALRVAVVSVSAVTPIVESPGEPGKSRFSAGKLDGQVAVVDVPGKQVLCRASIHVETAAFTSYAATADSADNSSVIADAWRDRSGLPSTTRSTRSAAFARRHSATNAGRA